jgi:multimeric flavodoxin WrbA/putative sterol carrier protein
MIPEKTPVDIIKDQFSAIANAYNNSASKKEGVIQLLLQHENSRIECCFSADGKSIDLDFKVHPNPTCTLTASLYDWLELSSDKLNPVWGVISGRLKFKGRTSVFGELINKSLLYSLSKPIPDDTPPVSNKKTPDKKYAPDIVIVNGSPRGQNGYTYHYISKLVEGVSKTDAKIKVLNICDHTITHCSGCFSCWKHPESGCIHHDDVNALYTIMDNSDIVVYAFPLYSNGVPGILKTFMDRGLYRYYPYMVKTKTATRHPKRFSKKRSIVVFSVCGFSEKCHFNAVNSFFRQMSHNAGSPISNTIYRSACAYLCDSPFHLKLHTSVTDSLIKAGVELGQKGIISSKLIRQIEKNVDQKEFNLLANKYWDDIVSKNNVIT